MRSAQGARFWSALVPGLCRGAPAQTTRVMDMGAATWFVTLGLLPEAQLYRFLKPFAALATAALERPQIGGL
jgi:hypothetical protein